MQFSTISKSYTKLETHLTRTLTHEMGGRDREAEEEREKLWGWNGKDLPKRQSNINNTAKTCPRGNQI